MIQRLINIVYHIMIMESSEFVFFLVKKRKFKISHESFILYLFLKFTNYFKIFDVVKL